VDPAVSSARAVTAGCSLAKGVGWLFHVLSTQGLLGLGLGLELGLELELLCDTIGDGYVRDSPLLRPYLWLWGSGIRHVSSAIQGARWCVFRLHHRCRQLKQHHNSAGGQWIMERTTGWS
jgi:hypothetical protein